MKIDEILKDRGKTHGDFAANAALSRAIKWKVSKFTTVSLSDIQLEAIDYIIGKISRICTGNPNHVDSWQDIQGYAKLAEKEINENPNI